MSDKFTCGVAVGTDLAVARAVRRAVVLENGIDCTFRNPVDGTETTALMPISVDQYSDWLNGTLIQEAMPMLSADDRELFISGMAW